MRRRKRDWPLTVYRYRLMTPVIAQTLYDTAERQRRLWNKLVEFWEHLKCLDAMYGFAGRGGVVGFWEVYEDYLKAQITVTALRAAGLDWVNGPDVIDRFKASIKRSGRVKFHGRESDISVAYRFSGGGKTLRQLQSPQARVMQLIMPKAPWVYASRRSERPHQHRPPNEHPLLRFVHNDQESTFRVIMHRALPLDSYVKRLTLSARTAGAQHWTSWHLCITVETPHGTTVRQADPQALVCSIDLGWRIFEGYLRVGMLTDSEGHLIELRLPWGISPDKQPPHRKGVSWPQTESELRSLRDLKRNEGLIEEAGRLSTTLRLLGLHWRERRKWFYYKLAHWLCQRYQYISWEGELDLQRLARRTESLPLQEAAKYRNAAAIGELRATIKLIGAKYGTEFVGAETAYSTVTCYDCGGQAKASPSLMIECPQCHHKWDQDRNAAYNLLAANVSPEEIDLLRRRWQRGEIKPLAGLPAPLAAEVQPE